MTAIKLDGKATAEAIKSELKSRVEALGGQGVNPGLGTILVGDDAGSKIYVDGKHRDCAEIGVKSLRIELPEDASTEDVLAAVRYMNESPACTGFLVQLPLPDHIDTDRVLEAVDPAKDVDGLHPINVGRLAGNIDQEFTSPVACTPRGIIELGRRGGVRWDGADVCLVGLGRTVGRPLSLLLSHTSINATADGCHIGTTNLSEHTKRADIVIAATGVAHLITPDMIRPGAAVFDVGITRRENPETGKTNVVGDVDPGVADVAGWLSPNPGGVGPMTRAMLLVNLVETAERLAST